MRNAEFWRGVSGVDEDAPVLLPASGSKLEKVSPVFCLWVTTIFEL